MPSSNYLNMCNVPVGLLSKECFVFPTQSSYGGILEQMRVIADKNLFTGQLSEMRLKRAESDKFTFVTRPCLSAVVTHGSRDSRISQVKFVEASL